MPASHVHDTTPGGYLKNFEDWQPDFAIKVADHHHITLETAHWEVIDCLRSGYAKTHISPNTRALVKLIQQALGPEKGNSLYLMTLFTGQAALIATKIAGLPKPKQCF